MESQPHARAAIATILGLIFIPWFITDPHWRNVLLGFVGLYVLYVMTEREEMLQPGKKAILITGVLLTSNITEQIAQPRILHISNWLYGIFFIAIH